MMVAGTIARLDVRVTNTGVAAQAGPAFARDVYRVRVAVDGAGWAAVVVSALVAIPNSASVTVPVGLARTNTAATSARVTVTIASESDASKTATVVTALRR
jgi:hypothetical protein